MIITLQLSKSSIGIKVIISKNVLFCC